MEKLPKLRTDIQIIPARLKEQQTVAVKDMLGLMKDGVVLNPGVASLLPFFDGEHTIRDLQMVLMRQSGNRLVMADEIEHVVHELDQLCLLQTEFYRTKKTEHKRSFTDLMYRPPSLAGSAYPENPEALKGMLQGIFAGVTNTSTSEPSAIRALIAPHIDISVGRSSYARAYAALNGIQPSRLIVLGTGHAN